jgi:hypothetical protein
LQHREHDVDHRAVNERDAGAENCSRQHPPSGRVTAIRHVRLRAHHCFIAWLSSATQHLCSLGCRFLFPCCTRPPWCPPSHPPAPSLPRQAFFRVGRSLLPYHTHPPFHPAHPKRAFSPTQPRRCQDSALSRRTRSFPNSPADRRSSLRRGRFPPARPGARQDVRLYP